ncbi:SDR family oxidoreductase [Lactiplantibacillus pentosus]|uniref:SDR family oxidoreductase n=1 Tax=Lactiplantibacillus pentosus TaxID=1589 RepID=UPI0021820EE8|nr:SDR family oxidoreductase [Lactiplantibacillus pentosus]
MMSISEKVIIITGASSGIGAATVKVLAQQHAKLVIGARRLARLTALKQALPNATIVPQQVDVTNYEDVQALVQTALNHFGRVDAFYNNAGIMPVNAMSVGARDEWQQILDVNVTGVLNGIAAVLPTMIKQQHGHILATDSVAGHIAVPDHVVYSGSKFAVRAIMEGLRQEQYQNNIRTTLISPGSVATELYQSIADKTHQQAEIDIEKQLGIGPVNIAQAVAFAINAPESVAVNEMVIRPTKQAI